MLRAIYFSLFLLCSSGSVVCQSEKWQRVLTGEEFTVDVSPSTLTFQPGRILRLQFRTIFSTPQTLNDNSRYKTSLETIEFRTDKRYRYYETTLLDAASRTVARYPPDSSSNWKTLRPGGTMNRLFDTAVSLPPLGRWTVITYHYADGKPKEPAEPVELKRLNGIQVSLQFDRAAVGLERCSLPLYESHSLADNNFYRKFGISLAAIGVSDVLEDAVIVKCESHDWTPAQSLFVPLRTGNALLLWKGVFLELKPRRG